MARKKRPAPNIADWASILEWEEQESEVPENEVYGSCDFCKGKILITEKYFFGSIPSNTSQNPGDLVFQACTRCVESAGIKW